MIGNLSLNILQISTLIVKTIFFYHLCSSFHFVYSFKSSCFFYIDVYIYTCIHTVEEKKSFDKSRNNMTV